MTLIVETPDTRAVERDYIHDVVFREFLGLDCVRRPAQRRDVCIFDTQCPGRAVILPDHLFQLPDEAWLATASLPIRSLPVWDSNDLELSITLVSSRLPVIYGDSEPVTSRQNGSVRLPLDIFGSAFFMLTRYEEVVKRDRDQHERFPAWASLADQEGFLQRPIVDEYVEVLWSTMKSMWPGLERRKRYFRIRVSHDVDRPALYAFGSAKKFLVSLAQDLMKYGGISSVLRAPYIRLRSKDRIHSKDPLNTFEWIMDVSEERGLKSVFFFLCGRTDTRKDADYDPEYPAIRALMRRIHERGHEIGLHPSYGTFRQPDTLSGEADRLRRVCAEEGIQQAYWGARMHFLRWDNPITLHALQQAAMTYDNTLCYADRIGFRCGTCHEYPSYDPVGCQPLRLRIRPLTAMELTVMGRKYMDLGVSEEALASILEIKNACKAVQGSFHLLWHNNELATHPKRELYKNIIDA